MTWDAIVSLHEGGAVRRVGGLRAWDALKVQTYSALQSQDATAFAEAALDLPDEDLRREVLLHLACLVPGSLSSVHERLAERRILYPGTLYWQAGAGARDLLLGQLSGALDTRSANHLLLCLAWVGDEVVQTSFATWRDRSPRWASTLHVPPHAYAAEAGWELTAGGGRRDLCSLASARLERSDDGDVAAAQPSPERCPWLARPLTELLDVPTNVPALGWLGPAAPRLRLVTCDQSTCFTHVYCELGSDGSPAWSPHNVKPDYLGGEECWEPLPPTRMTARRSLATPFWGHPLVWNGQASKLGGFPSWLQDAEYPRCPKCRRLMRFVGQLETSELSERGEGIYFAFVCPECKMGATGYQQT